MFLHPFLPVFLQGAARAAPCQNLSESYSYTLLSKNQEKGKQGTLNFLLVF